MHISSIYNSSADFLRFLISSNLFFSGSDIFWATFRFFLPTSSSFSSSLPLPCRCRIFILRSCILKFISVSRRCLRCLMRSARPAPLPRAPWSGDASSAAAVIIIKSDSTRSKMVISANNVFGNMLGYHSFVSGSRQLRDGPPLILLFCCGGAFSKNLSSKSLVLADTKFT